MKCLPAIDILDGKCVRLTRGDFDKSKIYNESPFDQAKIFENAGFKEIHIVDLNGYYYFANSYYADVSEQTTAISSYGDRFSAMTSIKNFTGVQFHPEKSGSLGYQFLHRFLSS